LDPSTVDAKIKRGPEQKGTQLTEKKATKSPPGGRREKRPKARLGMGRSGQLGNQRQCKGSKKKKQLIKHAHGRKSSKGCYKTGHAAKESAGPRNQGLRRRKPGIWGWGGRAGGSHEGRSETGGSVGRGQALHARGDSNSGRSITVDDKCGGGKGGTGRGKNR